MESSYVLFYVRRFLRFNQGPLVPFLNTSLPIFFLKLLVENNYILNAHRNTREIPKCILISRLSTIIDSFRGSTQSTTNF